MRRMSVALALAALSVAACKHSQGVAEPATQTQLSEADVGRLRPEQMGQVQQARQFQARADDERSRASLRLQQAQHEVELAKADQEEASAEAKRADAQSKIANDSREPAQIERARSMEDQARLHARTADAHLDYANKLVEARRADVDAADKQVQLAKERVESAQLQAMRRANIPAATKYDAGAFQTRVNEAQRSYDEAKRNAQQLGDQTTAAQQQWQILMRQLQAKRAAGSSAG